MLLLLLDNMSGRERACVGDINAGVRERGNAQKHKGLDSILT